ncbi:MAG TPA: hypothetical protein DCE56_26325 [Cyanobacteria bacterium UBA8553]|nr:hypothetical protein [Cyanobacteria bacterium UBA8553]
MNLPQASLAPHCLINSLTSSANQQVLCSLYILEGQYLLRYWENDQIITKFISSEAVRNAFSSLPVDSGFLPKGIVRIGSHKKGTWIVKFIPPSINNQITIENSPHNQVLSIPLPSLVLMGVHSQYYLWAIKSKQFDLNALVYNAPFPNINPSTGLICFGSNPVPTAVAIAIETVWNLFLNSPFNGDSVSRKSRTYPQDIRQQLVAITGKKHYPLRELVAISYPGISNRQITIAEVIEYLIKP